MYYLECAHAPTGHIVNSVKADFVSDRHLTSVDYFPVLIVINGSNHRSSTLLILYTIGFCQSARSDELLSTLKRLRAVLSLVSTCQAETIPTWGLLGLLNILM